MRSLRKKKTLLWGVRRRRTDLARAAAANLWFEVSIMVQLVGWTALFSCVHY